MRTHARGAADPTMSAYWPLKRAHTHACNHQYRTRIHTSIQYRNKVLQSTAFTHLTGVHVGTQSLCDEMSVCHARTRTEHTARARLQTDNTSRRDLYVLGHSWFVRYAHKCGQMSHLIHVCRKTPVRMHAHTRTHTQSHHCA